MVDKEELPVAKYKSAIIQAVEKNAALIISGETGSGKSTQIPQYLHQAGFTKHGQIAITQPRRLGAISVATRVSDEMDTHLGGGVLSSVMEHDTAVYVANK